MNYEDKNELRELEKTKAWIGRLINETIEWSCTDFQSDHAKYIIEILGYENTPKWIIDAANGE